MAPINRDNVQSLLLGPSLHPITRRLIFQVKKKDAGRQFLSDLLPLVSKGDPAPLGTAPLLNISLSWNGLLALRSFDTMGREAAAVSAFYMFNQPPLTESLRVFGASAPANWWKKRFQTTDIHIIIHLSVSNEDDLRNVTSRVKAAAERTELPGTRQLGRRRADHGARGRWISAAFRLPGRRLASHCRLGQRCPNRRRGT